MIENVMTYSRIFESPIFKKIDRVCHEINLTKFSKCTRTKLTRLPKNVVELRMPLYAGVKFKSQIAAGIMNEMPIVSLITFVSNINVERNTKICTFPKPLKILKLLNY